MIQATLTRRAVLRAGAAGLALAALPVRAVEALAAPAVASNTWTYVQWSSLVNATFTCASGNLKLVGATNLMPSGSSTTSGPQCFALTFSGSASAAQGQATQSLCNRKVGTVELFLVPGDATATAQHYGAIVNRL